MLLSTSGLNAPANITHKGAGSGNSVELLTSTHLLNRDGRAARYNGLKGTQLFHNSAKE